MKKKTYIIFLTLISTLNSNAMHLQRQRQERRRLEQLRQLKQSLEQREQEKLERSAPSPQQVNVTALGKKQINDKQIRMFIRKLNETEKYLDQLKKIEYSIESEYEISKIKENIRYLEAFTIRLKEVIPPTSCQSLEKSLALITKEFEKVKMQLELKKILRQVIQDDPLQEQPICKKCGIQSMAILTCKWCQNSTYCSRDCLAQDWPRHKDVCPQHVKHVENHICSVCSNFDPYIKNCSRCKKGRYCSRKCQVQDWPNHSRTCQRVIVEENQ